MDRMRLVELIKGETRKLSPKGRELWEEMEALVELSPEERDTAHQQAEILTQMAGQPPREQQIFERLMELHAGLYESDKREEYFESGERYRNQSVILAASLKDRSEGRQIDSDMTVEEAVARLRQ